ncbi:TetR/AcrR family transcriptional regulator [Streptomyces chrestomyceticus]|uniref:TetR/AcrR family transcriptional regulator n=1 Tax=Streptomyces chrestomyceticus TaxID=68185 RepID=UPI0037B1DCAC
MRPHEETPCSPSYHHGDLRAALVAAGEEPARKGGPGAIVLREVTRTVGVAPNAVYAHFATLAELKIAVSQHALREMAAAMSVHLGQVHEPADPREAAKAHLREVGRAYVLFALDEPGLFRAAMDDNPASDRVPGEGDAGRGGRASDQSSGPATLLVAALDRLTGAEREAAIEAGRHYLLQGLTLRA